MGKRHWISKLLSTKRRSKITKIWLGATAGAAVAALLFRGRVWLRLQGHALALWAGKDGDFVLHAARDGTAEVELGHLGAKLGARDDVRQLGLRLVQDHGRLNSALMNQAFARGVAPPINLGPRRRALIARLGRLAGDGFDRAYVGALIDVHREALSAFRREARSGEDPALRALAERGVPLLEDHLRAAESIQARLR